MKNFGPSLITLALFIRDRAAQAVADLLVARLGVGPFGVATGLLRVAAVLQAATLTSRVVSGQLQMGSIFEVAMAGLFCWVCLIWAKATATAALRRPSLGSATASALRRDDYLVLIVLVVAFLAWDVVTLVGGRSLNEALTTASDMIQGLGFLLGSTVWRDLPRSRQRSYVVAPSAT
ncbi:MAG: hypothetical protein ACRYGP_17690 [Janthinobacterium lividum]